MDILTQAGEIAALAYGEVDRRSGVLAATVVEPAPQGRITEVLFWNPATGSFQATPPTVMVGQQFGVAVYGLNLSSSYLMSMYVVAAAISPDGTREEQALPAITVDPGVTGVWQAFWTALKPGSHRLDLALYAEWAGLAGW